MKTQLVTLFAAAFLLGNFARAQQALSCLMTSGTAPSAGSTAQEELGGGGQRERFELTEFSAAGAGGKVDSDRLERDRRGHWFTGPVEVPEYYIPRPHPSRGAGSFDDAAEDWSGSRNDRSRDFNARAHFTPAMNCSPIPEPSTYAFLIGLTAFGLVIRQRFSRVSEV